MGLSQLFLQLLAFLKQACCGQDFWWTVEIAGYNHLLCHPNKSPLSTEGPVEPSVGPLGILSRFPFHFQN